MSVMIASVHFAPLTARRNYRSTPYTIDGIAKEGDPANVLLIKDTREVEWGAYDGNVARKLNRYTVTALEIASDIISQWTQWGLWMSPDSHPGVWLVREELPVFGEDGKQIIDEDQKPVTRRATDEERAAMWAEDEARERLATSVYADRLIARADEIADDPKANAGNPISTLMRDAAVFRGADRGWLHKRPGMAQKTCNFCGGTILADVIKCIHCSEVVDPVRYAQAKAALEAALVAQQNFDLEQLTKPDKHRKAS